MSQNKLPKDWNWFSLIEIMNNYDGKRKPISKEIRSKRKGEFRYYGATEIVDYIDDFIFDGEYLLIGEDGANLLSKNKDLAFIVTGKFWVNNHAHVLSSKEVTTNKYVCNYFNSLNISQFVTGTAQPKLTQGNLNKIKIPLPPLETQQAIVSKIEELFSELDKGIEDLKTAQQQLKTYRQSVLKYAFEGKLTNKKVKEGELPKGWEWKKIKDICEIKGGKNQSKVINPEGKYPVYGSSGIFGYADEFICNENTTIVGRKGNINSPLYVTTKFWNVDTAFGLCTNENYDSKLLFYFCLGFNFKKLDKSTTIPSLAKSDILSIDIPLPPSEEQHQIVQEIESRLIVADKMEESIVQSLLQAESLRQSILKKAFSGELVKEVIQGKIHKPKNDYFFQMQLIGKIAAISKRNKIEHGEMTIAKYAYLSDKLFDIPTGFEFNRWHLGPYPAAIKKVVNNKQYFQRIGNHIEVINEQTLFKSTNDFSTSIDDAVSNLVSLFSKYKTSAERSHKTELLATVCKVIEDIKTTDLKLVRASMKEWKIVLKTSSFKNKAEKFNEEETKNCIEFIAKKGWVKKLIK